MPGREFDTAKGAFLLVVVIVATQMLLSLLVVGGCLLGRFEDVLQPGACKGVLPEMREIFQQCFTAAIAFAGGRLSAPATPRPTLPDERKPS